GRNVTNVAHLTLAVGVALAPDKTSLPIVDSTLIGRTFNLDVPALGPPGPATIVALRPCPPIEAGPGRVVTGWFRHPSAATIDLVVDVEKRPLGTTDNHPFWSEDRHAFVPAGELRVGETLRTASGNQTHVIAKTTRGVTEDVFNLEVEGMHTYFVGDKGVLVHNKGDLITGPIKEAGEKLANSHTRSDDTKKMWQALKALWKGQPQVASAGNPLPANDAPPPGGALWYQTQVLTVLNRFTTAPFSQTGARPGFNSDAVGALQSLIVLIEKGNSP
ncbi:MAG TPA: polymorphic toxin-type HINT domain-containing protein, partial [Planctomycetaceae bacterium]|nr:polymorphic toxin-type HINT domain-containing protein [Planctomycetaceae bacterium]